MAAVSDSTTRFSSRVDDYVKYRPSYPTELVKVLEDHFALPENATIVDVGSGTGILTRILLEQLSHKKVRVIGVEPNKDMREAGDKFLASYVTDGRFKSIDGTAENMDLPDHSVDLIVAAQAFHWFDVPRARKESQRVLKPGNSAGVALIWNERRGVVHPDRESQPPAWNFENLDLPVMNATDLMLVRSSSEYPEGSFKRTVYEASMKEYFGPDGFRAFSCPNSQSLDYDGLKGRLLSSSYTPQQGQPGHDEMIQELRRMFDKYQKDGKVDFMYDTRVFYGPLS